MEMTTINMISLGGGNEVEGQRNNPQKRERETGSHVLSFQSSPLPSSSLHLQFRGERKVSIVICSSLASSSCSPKKKNLHFNCFPII